VEDLQHALAIIAKVIQASRTYRGDRSWRAPRDERSLASMRYCGVHATLHLPGCEERMPSPSIIFVALSLVVSIAAILMILRSPAADVRMLPKPLWYLVALVPIVGAIGWFHGWSAPGGSIRQACRQRSSAPRKATEDHL